MQLKSSSRGSATGRALPGRPAFTLLELLVVIALIATLTFVAVPAFKGFGQANALAAAQRQIQDDLALARQLAIKQRVPVYMVFFSPNPDRTDPSAQAFAAQVASIHTTLAAQADSDYREHALRVFTNLFAGQHASYAFYAEGRVGDQPVLASDAADPNGAADLRLGRYLTVGGSIWRTLPDGIVLAPQMRLRLATQLSTNLPTRPVPFPLAAEPGDGASLQLALPVIAYDALGRSMVVNTNTGRIEVNAPPVDRFVAIGHGSVFIPHDPVATNNFAFGEIADLVEAPKENYTNTIFRVTGLTGRARKFAFGTQP
jgi:prepilin-type N-terminal cleavage/methylation domain-containing protein